MANIPIYDGNPVWTSDSVPFGFYSSDTEFQTDAVKVAKFCATRLGYPLTDVELQSGSFFTAFEEAITTYGNELYAYKIRDNQLSLEGLSTGSSLNTSIITPSFESIVRLTEQYGVEAGTGGNVPYYSGSISLTSSIQDYDIAAWAEDQGITGSIEIKKVFYQESPAITRFYDPYVGTGFGYQSLFDYFAKQGYDVTERRPDGYPPKEGVEGYQVSKGSDRSPQSVIFQYNPSTDQFTISRMSGYRIDQKDAIKAGMRQAGRSGVAGIDSYMTDGNYNPVDISVEGLKDIVDHVMGGLEREAKAQGDFYKARGNTSGTIDELKAKIASVVKEKLSKNLKEFKVGDKVTYLGHPGEITKVNKEMTGAITYNVLYDKGEGKTKVTNIYNKGGEIKAVKEKLTKRSSVEKHIEDFKDSDAPQFKGKSQEKRRKMAVAAYLSKKDKK